MTREEEIKCAASRFCENCTDMSLDANRLARASFREGFHDGFIKGANWADNYPRENADRVQAAEMDVWVARDKDGRLMLFNSQPVNCITFFHPSGAYPNLYMELPTSMCPEVKFENSPVKMRLILEQ